jgi:hypothetical protein
VLLCTEDIQGCLEVSLLRLGQVGKLEDLFTTTLIFGGEAQTETNILCR